METFDGETMLLLGDKKYTFSKLVNGTTDPCYYNVEVKTASVSTDFKASIRLNM